MPNLKTAAIIVAAGSGIRFGGNTKKQFIDLNGKPLLYYSLIRFELCKLISDIYLVLPKENIEFYDKKINKFYKFHKIKKIIPGGKQRQDSVYNGISHVPRDTDILVIHDAVRPLVSSEIIESVVNESAIHGCSVCAIHIKDTVKQSINKSEINATIPRDTLWLAQTPQAFRYDIINEAFNKAIEDNFVGTDESSLVERIGYKPHIVMGSEYNIKITKPSDLKFAEMYLD